MGNREGGTCSVGNFRTSRCSVAPSSCNKSFRIVISGPLNTEGSFMSFQTCKSFVDPDCYTKSVRLYIAMYGQTVTSFGKTVCGGFGNRKLTYVVLQRELPRPPLADFFTHHVFFWNRKVSVLHGQTVLGFGKDPIRT